jgi:hypothetical protein
MACYDSVYYSSRKLGGKRCFLVLLSIATWVNDKSRLSLPIFGIFALLSGLALGCGGGGKTGQNDTLTVVAPSNLAYPQPTITATVGKAIIADMPAVTGTVDSYTVSPTLPAGLSLNSSTGAISGTPTAVAVQATYTVVARNSAGSTSAMIQVTVNAVWHRLTSPILNRSSTPMSALR